MRVVRWIGVVELVVVVGNVTKQAAGGQQVVGQPEIGGRHHPKLIHVEAFWAAHGLVQYRIDMEIEAGLLHIPTLLGALWHLWLNAFLHQGRLMPQRLPRQMTLQTRHVGFGGHLRQVKTVLGHADGFYPFRQIVSDNPIRPLNTLFGITILHLLAGNIERIAFHLDLRIRQPGIVLQLRKLIRHHRVLHNGVLRLRLILRAGVVVVRGAQVVEVRVQGKAKHHRVAALVAQVDVGPVRHAVGRPDVKLASLRQTASKILLIVIALILQLQAQRLPRRLVLYAAEQRCRAVEHLATVNGASLLVAVIAVAVLLIIGAERVFNIARRAEVAPAQSEGKIKWSPGLAGNEVLGVEQSRPADIARAHGDLRQPVALFPQAQLQIERFIFVGLIAGEGLHAAVLSGTYVGVAQGGLQPGKELNRTGVVAVLIVIAIVKANLALTRHPGGRRLQQPHAAKIGLGRT